MIATSIIQAYKDNTRKRKGGLIYLFVSHTRNQLSKPRLSLSVCLHNPPAPASFQCQPRTTVVQKRQNSNDSGHSPHADADWYIQMQRNSNPLLIECHKHPQINQNWNIISALFGLKRVTLCHYLFCFKTSSCTNKTCLPAHPQ